MPSLHHVEQNLIRRHLLDSGQDFLEVDKHRVLSIFVVLDELLKLIWMISTRKVLCDFARNLSNAKMLIKVNILDRSRKDRTLSDT